MSGKWLELLKESAPEVERVGFMMHPENAPLVAFFKSAEAVAPSLKLELVPLGVHDAGEIERSVTAFATERNGGIVASKADRPTRRRGELDRFSFYRNQVTVGTRTYAALMVDQAAGPKLGSTGRVVNVVVDQSGQQAPTQAQP